MDKSRLVILQKKVPENAEEFCKKPNKFLTDNRIALKKKMVTVLIYLIAIPMTLICSYMLVKGGHYNIVSLIIAILSIIPLFMRFERGRSGAKELVVIAMMTAISVTGRLVFAPLPGFKPVTAIVILTAVAYGAEAGFVTGAMSALVSNLFFGQGPWTPFQMLAWGVIGLLTGLLFGRKKNPNIILLSLVGIVGGVLYSLLMDIWTVLSVDSTFSWGRYASFIVASLPFMAVYAVSNVIFLVIGAKPLLVVLSRMRDKYGVFSKP